MDPISFSKVDIGREHEACRCHQFQDTTTLTGLITCEV